MSTSLIIPIKVTVTVNDSDQSGTLFVSDEQFKTLIDKIQISENALDAFLFLQKYLSNCYSDLHSLDPTTFTVTLQPKKPRSTGCDIPKRFRDEIVRIEIREAIRDYRSERDVLRSALSNE